MRQGAFPGGSGTFRRIGTSADEVLATMSGCSLSLQKPTCQLSSIFLGKEYTQTGKDLLGRMGVAKTRLLVAAKKLWPRKSPLTDCLLSPQSRAIRPPGNLVYHSLSSDLTILFRSFSLNGFVSEKSNMFFCTSSGKPVMATNGVSDLSEFLM